MGVAATNLRGKAAVLLAATAAVAMAAVLSLTAFTSTAYAGGGAVLQAIYKGTHKVAMLSGASAQSNTLIYGSDAYKPITKAKSSNKGVATVKVTKYPPQKYGSYTQPGYYTLSVTLKKTGTTKISYTYKGKKHTATFKVRKYVNPMKSFKLGSKEYKNCFDAKKIFINPRVGYITTLTTNSIKGKLKVTPASGWKVNKIYYGSPQVPSSVKKISNGATVKQQFTIEMKNKSTGFVETFSLQPTISMNTATTQTGQGGSGLQAASI